MDFLHFFNWLNVDVLAFPSTVIIFGMAIYLTLKTRCIQLRALPRFFSLITGGVRRKEANVEGLDKSMGTFHALFAAMATTIGMGNMVGPSMAIITGGPGALFWLVVYILLGSVTKFTEVTYALHTRITTEDGHIVGGPMRYLAVIHPYLATWYTYVMIILFTCWSSVQTNTLASVFELEGLPRWSIGATVALLVLLVLSGGAKRVGALASKLVPLMFIFYISFALLILFKDLGVLSNAFRLVFQSIFKPAAAMGGFFGATIFQAMSVGVYRGVLISESGVGTSSIPHAMADTKNPVDQGILAMGSTIADAMLSIVSGLLVLVTGVWIRGEVRSTLIYEAFKMHAPLFGNIILLISITLFVVTTVIGNSFNGTRIFGSLTNHRYINAYLVFTVLMIFAGSLLPVELAWGIMDTMQIFAVVPNLIGLFLLTLKKPDVIKFK